jgi:hypothetical protein
MMAHPARLVLAIAYAVAGIGVIVMAFDSILFNRWASVALEGVGLLLLVVLLRTGWAWLWLIVGAVWLYAATISAFRGVDSYERAGVALIFLALAFGALAAYVAETRRVFTSRE